MVLLKQKILSSAMQGLLLRLACDPSGNAWLVTGSSRGQLTLWDVRFRLPVLRWAHPASCSIDAMAPALASPLALGVGSGGPGTKGPLIYVAAGPHEVGLWHVEDGRCLQVH